MKTTLFSMIAMATLVAMTACTSESDPVDDAQKDGKVEIKMSAGVLNITTKSEGPINGLSAAITDVAFLLKEGTKDAATIDWTSGTTSHGATIGQTNGTISFETDAKPYYSSSNDTYSYLVGYHPKTGGTLASGIVSYTLDGNTDVMYAQKVSGNKENNKATPLTPKFEHLLSQLVIKITGEQNATTAWGTISSISVKDIQTKVSLNLGDGKLTADTENNTAAPLPITKSGDSYPAITTGEVEVGYCMILPQESEKQFVLTVATDKATKDVTVNIPEGIGESTRPANTTIAGEAYVITLTFKASEILATASVDTWTEVAGGTGTVD